MMKGLYSRLVSVYAILLVTLLTGLGIVLGQFFSLFSTNVEASTQRYYLIYLVVILVMAFILSLLVAIKFLRTYAKPIDEITAVATKIAQGDFTQQFPVSETHYEDELSIAIKQISGKMQKMSTVRGVEKERLKTLIESMGSGFFNVRKRGYRNISKWCI